ncbi:MAG: GNAT family N-acetyltransferase [Halioglobus sp.]
MAYTIQVYRSYTELPAQYAELVTSHVSRTFFERSEWFEFLLQEIYDDDQLMALYALEDAATGRLLMFVPMRYTLVDAAARGANTVATLGHMENYTPACFLVAPGAENQRREMMTELFTFLRQTQGGHTPEKADVVRLWPFEVGSSLGDDVYAALKTAGFLVQRYANSHNTYEDCAGQDFEQYMANRSANHRYNSRRRRRNLEKEGELEFVLVTNSQDRQVYDRAIDDYILVSVHSWKPVGTTVSTPIIGLIHMAAEQGCLRLAILRLDGKPIAAQFWLIAGGVAAMMRPNYHSDYGKLAPGVVLTSFVIEHLLDVDHVESLDFGYGDDEYKSKWVSSYRSYEGLIAFNPTSVFGLLNAAKHILGRKVKRLLQGGRAANERPLRLELD